MNKEIAKGTSAVTKFKDFINSADIQKEFTEALGKKAPMTISNLVSVVSNNVELQKCDPSTVVSASIVAASMDLPVVPGLGFAGIVPYWDNKSKKYKAQFQIMKKGYVQLAQRTGLFQFIHVSEVYEGELIKHNRFTGEYVFDESKKKSDKIIGYVSYFKLLNGFEKYYFMSIKEIEKHAKQYSKSYQKGYGRWADKEEGGFQQMSEKTVLKLNLSSWAPLSVDTNLQKAIMYDQAEIKDLSGEDYEYIDNEGDRAEKELIEVGGKEIVIDKKGSKRSANITSSRKKKDVATDVEPIEDFSIPEKPKGKDREFEDFQNIMGYLETIGLDDSNYKAATTELIHIEKDYPTLDKLCFEAPKQDIERVIEKFQKSQKH